MTWKHHEIAGAGGWECPVTGEIVDQVFTDHDRPGCYNACAECHEDKRTIAERLHDLNESK